MSLSIPSTSSACDITTFPSLPPESHSSLIEKINNYLDIIFGKRNEAAAVFQKVISDTHDLNAQADGGWTLLHYCSYFSEDMKAFSGFLDPQGQSLNKMQKMAEFMQYLIEQGANVEAQDCFGRTPVYFQSGNNDTLGTKFLDCLLQANANVDPDNDVIKPLHVIAGLTNKCVDHFIQKEAYGYALDKYGRMPLHCAVCNWRDSQFHNVRLLVEHAPLATACADVFGNYPLDYAIVFGSDELIDFMTEHTSSAIVDAVIQKIQQQGIPQTDEEVRQLETALRIRDDIYDVPQLFRLIYGGMPPKKEKKVSEVAERLEKSKIKKIYNKDDKIYYLDPDDHASKHFQGSKKKKEDLIAYTKHNPATFYLECVKIYSKLLETAIKHWVDQGADGKNPYVTFSNPIGADAGHETSTVEIYYGHEIGSHIRPKHI